MFSCILLQNELDNTNSCYQLFMTIAISEKKKHIMKFIWEKIYGGGIVWLQLYRIFNKNKQLMRESRLSKL